MNQSHGEVDTRRLASYLVGEIWPRFVKKFRAENVKVYEVIRDLARVFVLPKEASLEQLMWFMGFFVEQPDLFAWVLNELRIESDKLTSLDLDRPKGDVGALKFLALIGIKDWRKSIEFTESGAIQEAASQILREDHSALDRKFENVFRQVGKREDIHRETYRELVRKSVPPYRSVAETYPVIGEKFPQLVEMIDKKAHESRVRESIVGNYVGSILTLQSAIVNFVEALRAAESEDDSDNVKNS